jgi:hypothetical protein
MSQMLLSEAEVRKLLVLTNPNAHHHKQKSPPMDPIQSQFNPVYIF